MRATNGHFKWSNQHLNVANVLQPSPPENGKWVNCMAKRAPRNTTAPKTHAISRLQLDCTQT